MKGPDLGFDASSFPIRFIPHPASHWLSTEGIAMILGLSGRLIETGTGYALDMEDFLDLVRRTGYQGVEIRSGQVSAATSEEEVKQVRSWLDARGLCCAFLTAASLADAETVEAQTKLLDHAVALGCRHIRVHFLAEAVSVAQAYADRAADRGLRLISQLHNGTAFANVDMAIEMLGKIDRDNFGVAFEACHLVFDGQEDCGEGAVKRLGDRIFTVSLQAYKLAPSRDTPNSLVINDKPWVRALPGDPEGPDLRSVFRGLKAIGFDGFVTVMCDAYPGMGHEELAVRWRQHLQDVLQEARFEG